MKHFTVYDPRTGKILRSGTCQDHMLSAQAKQGESVIERQYPEGAVRLDLASFEAAEMYKEPEPSYGFLRLHDYPTKGEQLDTLWKLVIFWQESHSLPLTHEAETMLQRILAVKEKHPKS